MGIRLRNTVLLVATALGALVLPALAQQVREQPLQANPYRDIGGSCVYGRNGELLHSPKGSRCAVQEEVAPPAAAAGTAGRFGGLPPALRTEANALVDSHTHVADHLVELRRAIVLNDKTKAIATSDEVAKELIEHLAREQALFEKLASEHRAH